MLGDFDAAEAEAVLHAGPPDANGGDAPRLEVKASRYLTSAVHEKRIETWEGAVSRLRRCNKCVLPETYPFIEFDEDGVCSFCRTYKPTKLKSMSELHAYCDYHRSQNGEADCLVALSGGRDSCYVLHYLKTELDMHPITYTYDWGLVTDLARRNTSRMCGRLGVEHVLISADYSGAVTKTVERSTFRVSVTQRGELDSMNNETLFCNVEGGAKIISIVPVGTKVKKGQIEATKIGRNFAISKEYIESNIAQIKEILLSDQELIEIKKIVDQTYTEYGEVLQRLGKY